MHVTSLAQQHLIRTAKHTLHRKRLHVPTICVQRSYAPSHMPVNEMRQSRLLDVACGNTSLSGGDLNGVGGPELTSGADSTAASRCSLSPFVGVSYGVRWRSASYMHSLLARVETSCASGQGEPATLVASTAGTRSGQMENNRCRDEADHAISAGRAVEPLGVAAVPERATGQG